MPVVPATSQRKAIRAAIKALLLNATRAGASVFTNRTEAWEATTELPAISIYTDRERPSLANEAPREYQREIDVRIELIVRQNGLGAGDDELGAFVQEVIAILVQHESANDSADRSWYTGHEISTVEGGEHLLLAAHIRWTFRYFTIIDETPDAASSTLQFRDGWRFATDLVGQPDRANDIVSVPA